MAAGARPDEGFERLLAHQTRDRTLPWKHLHVVATVLLFPAALYGMLELGLALHRALGG